MGVAAAVALKLALFEFPTSFMDDPDRSFAGLHPRSQSTQASERRKRALRVLPGGQVLA